MRSRMAMRCGFTFSWTWRLRLLLRPLTRLLLGLGTLLLRLLWNALPSLFCCLGLLLPLRLLCTLLGLCALLLRLLLGALTCLLVSLGSLTLCSLLRSLARLFVGLRALLLLCLLLGALTSLLVRLCPLLFLLLRALSLLLCALRALGLLLLGLRGARSCFDSRSFLGGPGRSRDDGRLRHLLLSWLLRRGTVRCRNDGRVRHLATLRLRQHGDRMRWHGRQALYMLWRRQNCDAAARDICLHRRARGRDRGAHRHHRLLRRRQMSLVRYGGLKCAPVCHGTGRCLDHDVGHVANVRDVVVGDAVVVDDRVVAVDVDVAVHAHAHVHYRRCTHHNCRRRAHRGGNDDAWTGPRRRRDEDPGRAHWRRPNHDIDSDVGPGDRPVI